MSRRVIAVIDWRSAAVLKDNARFFERADISHGVRARDVRTGLMKYRSLTLWEDGTCELQRFSTAAVVRRLGGVIVPKNVRKMRMG